LRRSNCCAEGADGAERAVDTGDAADRAGIAGRVRGDLGNSLLASLGDGMGVIEFTEPEPEALTEGAPPK